MESQQVNDLFDLNEEKENKEVEKSTEEVVFSKNKLVLAKKLLQNLKDNVDQLNNLFGTLLDANSIERISIGQAVDESVKGLSNSEQTEKIVEGVFDGEAMIGPDGKRYNISANYASKSKLVEGDILKLSITSSGTFLYKQIGPIERQRLVVTVKRTGENEFIVVKDDKSWKVLNASVTYFKGDDGDEAVILVPKAGESRWAAVENIIKQA